jgi:hypothetical protein
MHTKLANIADIRTGFPFRSKVIDDPSGKIAVVQMKDIGDAGRLDPNGYLHIQEEPAHGRHLLRQGDVLLQSRGSKFPAAMLETDINGIAALGLHVLRPGKEVLPEYLSWVMNHPQIRDSLIGLARGSYIPFLSKADLAELRVPLPPLATQQRIVKVARLEREAARLTDHLKTLREHYTATITWNAATRSRKPIP